MNNVVICPFISSGTHIVQCTPNCAMYVKGKCAVRLLAENLCENSSCVKGENLCQSDNPGRE